MAEHLLNDYAGTKPMTLYVERVNKPLHWAHFRYCVTVRGLGLERYVSGLMFDTTTIQPVILQRKSMLGFEWHTKVK